MYFLCSSNEIKKKFKLSRTRAKVGLDTRGKYKKAESVKT